MLAPKPSSIYNGRLSFANPMYLKKAQSEKPCLYVIPYDKDDLANIFSHDREETLTLEQESRSKLNKDKVKSYDYTKKNNLYEIFKPPTQKHLDQLCELTKLIEKMKGKTVDTKFDKPSDVRQPNALRIPKPSVLGVIHITSVSRPQLRSTQMKEKVVHNNSQVKFKKTEVEDHHRISSISNKTKSVTACNDSLKSRTSNVNVIVQLILFIVDSGITKHMTGNLKLLCNFVKKYLGTVWFGNDQFAPILSYGDLVQDCIPEINFFVRDLQGNDLLSGNHRSDLYTISLQDTTSPTSICFMAKGSPTQEWLRNRRLSHLNFDSINLLSKKDIVIGLSKLKYVNDQLCSSCELSKAKRSTFKIKDVPSLKGWLNLLHMDLCGPMQIKSINGKKYLLVIVDDYSRYTWTHFLRTKDETSEVLKDFLKMIQCNLQAQVITVRTDRGTKFLNKTLHGFIHINSGPAPQLQKTSIHNSTELGIHDHNNEPSSSKLVPTFSPSVDTDSSQQELDLLFSPLYDEFFNAGNPSVPKYFALSDNSPTQATQPTTNVQTTTTPITPTTTATTEENNTDIQAEIQVENTQIDKNEFYNIFSTPVREKAESSTRYVDPSNMHKFYQRHQSKHRWTKDHR
ncbi:retrovirus-related pol polyprotein from transposon TNT 1-94 [Tanacetum coccineum]